MDWFKELKLALPESYTNAHPLDIVGYLQGAGTPNIWRQMAQSSDRHQMLILGNAPPTSAEWADAGVAARGQVQTIRITNLAGWIVLYGGYMLQRPWGQLFEMNEDAKNLGFPGSLKSWKANKPKKR